MTITARIGRTPSRTSSLGPRNPISGARAARQPRGDAHSVRTSPQQLSSGPAAGRGRLAITARRARSPSPTTTAHAAEKLKASAMRVNAHTPKVVHTDYLVRSLRHATPSPGPPHYIASLALQRMRSLRRATLPHGTRVVNEFPFGSHRLRLRPLGHEGLPRRLEITNRTLGCVVRHLHHERGASEGTATIRRRVV